MSGNSRPNRLNLILIIIIGVLLAAQAYNSMTSKSKLVERIKEMENERVVIVNQVEEMEKELNQKMESYQKLIDNHNERISTLTSEISKTRTLSDQVKEELKVLEEEAKAIEETGLSKAAQLNIDDEEN